MSKIVPFLRGGNYQFRKRVPRRYAAVEPMPFVQLSLHTDSLTVANQKAPIVWAELIEAWEAKLAGESMEGDERLNAARALAQKRGFRFMPIKEVANLPIKEVLQRLDQIKDQPTRADLPVIEAMLGTPEKSKIRVSQALDEFYSVAGERVIGKNDDQLRRHKNPRIKATKNFIDAVADKELTAITAEDMFEFRKWLAERVVKGEISAASANKDMTYLLAMWKPVAQSKGFKLGFDTEGLMLKTVRNSRKDTRPPFSDKWIKERLLADGALGGLNTDARLILLGMINTGYRPSEGAGLLPDEIVLTANVPHIIIQPNKNRALKNTQSERIIPLTGVSLEAFREAKNGFPRYAKNSATLSATVNKYLTERNLLETPKHVMYSLRHAMEDRMLTNKVDERIRMDILGHQISRERYGKGGELAHIHGLLNEFAI